MCKRILVLLLCLSLTLCWCLPASATVVTGRSLHIRSVEDLLKLAENCVLDSYSKGLTVYLDCDLDLSGSGFSGIPTFGGTFEGRGRSITGLELDHKGSVVGFFRYLQSTAIVRNLSVSGYVTPGGSATVVGGIVGSNSGMVKKCSFEGSVSGKSEIGAIAGINELEGYILDCDSSGVVVGETMTGGIAGNNAGLIESCENGACINISSQDATVDISSIDVSVLMDPTSLSSGITVMDTGGIAGYSTGAIYDCKNFAAIGYPHIGYNVGGIAGRSCGIISGCSNEAEIQGRKDVGGIVGQMEPNVTLNLHEDYVQQMEQLLEELKGQTQQMQDSFNRLGVVHDHLNNTLDHVDGASASLESLAGHIDDYGNAITDEVNRLGLIIDEIMDEMVPVMKQATALSTSLSDAMDIMASALYTFALASDYMEISLIALNQATIRLTEAGENATVAMELIEQGLESLGEMVQVEEPDQLQSALDKITLGLSQLADALEETQTAAEIIANVMQQEGSWDDALAEAFDHLVPALSDMVSALRNLSEGMIGISDNIHFSGENFWNGIHSIQQGLEYLSAAAEDLSAAMEYLSIALSWMERTSDVVANALRIMADAMKEFENSFDIITQMSRDLTSLVDRVSRYEPLQMPYLAEEAADAVDQLFMHVNAISDELRGIVNLSDTFSQEATTCLDEMTKTFSALIETALKMVDQVQGEVTSGVITDTSDVDIDSVKTGKVSQCVNTGLICGDINVGGIAGAMAIEYSMDPEDDISSELSNWEVRTYQAKAVVQDCTNLGIIDGKRNCVGGICGKMDMGIILLSGNFADVSSAEGSYVGGIAGESDSVIRQCQVKATLSGANYVGGVAGLGSKVTDCYVLVEMTGSEKTGTILGYTPEMNSENISGNLFYPVAGNPGAIDGISYDGCARPVSGEAFLELQGLDPRFPEAVLTFCYEDGTLEVLRFPVGTELRGDMVPALENTENQILSWQGLAEYMDRPVYFDGYFTVERTAKTAVLESQQSRADGKPVVLLQGAFCSNAKVELIPVTEFEGAVEGWSFEIPSHCTLNQIRYACPEGKQADHLQIWVQGSDGSYRTVTPSHSGSYLVFAVEDGTTHFYVTEIQQEGEIALWMWIFGGAVFIAIFTTIVLIVRKKKSPTHKQRSRRKAS